MKTEEDEAFEDIERRQGGGFQAKRAAAADKAQDESDMLTIAYLDGYERGKRAVLAQPAQEPVAWMYEWDGKKHLTFTDQRFVEQAHPHFNKSTPLYTASHLQHEWVEVECPLCGEMAVANTHPNLNKREWAGLTDEEQMALLKDSDGKTRHWLVWQVEAKLKEKNT